MRALNGTKDRKRVFKSTNEYIGTKGWCTSDCILCVSVRTKFQVPITTFTHPVSPERFSRLCESISPKKSIPADTVNLFLRTEVFLGLRAEHSVNTQTEDQDLVRFAKPRPIPNILTFKHRDIVGSAG